MAKLQEGRRYAVRIDGASLTWSVPKGPGWYGFDSCKLDEGDVLTFEGYRHGPGSDTVAEATFTSEDHGVTGSFRPSFWGMVPTGALEVVS